MKKDLSEKLDEKVIFNGDSKRRNTGKFTHINNEKYDTKYVELLNEKGIEIDIDRI